MKNYKTIIFDLDGTLLDTLDDLKNSTNYALSAMGYPIRTREEVRSFVGNGVRKLIERAVPAGTSSEKAEETLTLFKTHYAAHCEDRTAPYEGILPLLDKLLAEGKTLAVVSNKLDSAVSVLCKKYFGDRFAVTVGDREGVRQKPAPDSVYEVLKFLHMSGDDAVYIGDSEVDVMTAKNAEMDCISVTWGFRDFSVLQAAWGFEEPEKYSKVHSKEGKSAEKVTAYFADTVPELEKLLLSPEKS